MVNISKSYRINMHHAVLLHFAVVCCGRRVDSLPANSSSSISQDLNRIGVSPDNFEYGGSHRKRNIPG